MPSAQLSVSATIEDYAKAIYSLEHRTDEPVGTTALAERLGVTAGSASAMIQRLHRQGLVEHVPYRGVRLTDDGRRVALHVLRHHRLLELFLAEELGMSWDRVHAEAEVLEHVLSEDLERLIAERLKDPTRDPHGDPIPSVELEIEERPTVALAELPDGATGVFSRVSDADAGMLRYLDDRGLRPGDRVEVVERRPFGADVRVRCGAATHVLGGELAQAMRVEVDV